MYTKEDIEKAKQYLNNEGYGNGSNFTLNVVANLMAEYAVKNCSIPSVVERSEQLICPCCGSDKTYKTDAIHCNRCAVTTEI